MLQQINIFFNAKRQQPEYAWGYDTEMKSLYTTSTQKSRGLDWKSAEFLDCKVFLQINNEFHRY